jgi:small subunit ribosomal protein S16
MAARIRLTRMGRKKAPHYRIVVAHGSSPRDGRVVENLGYYKPVSQPARLVLNMDRVDYWIGQGALPTETVRSLLAKARRGGDGSVALGEPDLDAKKKARAEALAAERRAAEEKAKAEAAAKAEVAAKAEADAAAKAEAEAAAKAEAEAAAKAEAEAAAAAEAPAAEEAVETPAAEVAAPEAAAPEAPAAEAPAAEAEAEAPAVEAPAEEPKSE